EAFEELSKKKYPPRRVSIATGRLAYGFISELAQRVNETIENVHCDVYAIRNDYFGETITVSGLITAQDIMAQLKDKQLGDELLLPSNMIMRNSDIFLDDYTVSDVEKALNIKVRITENDGRALLEGILGL
ncbi:MAG: DUF512 domain-containing protein, partial [Oscillospiraceae bacterium]|nr:DUF512 domain-containing protein [Oscillospiraceae bacterium]